MPKSEYCKNLVNKAVFLSDLIFFYKSKSHDLLNLIYAKNLNMFCADMFPSSIILGNIPKYFDRNPAVFILLMLARMCPCICVCGEKCLYVGRPAV